jgi:2-phospho-L-lactate guanylyltransferase (CobY/MobA/RfbA family)
VAPPRPALVVFLGGLGGSPVEEMVAGTRAAAAVDSIETALACGRYERAVLVTDGLTDIPHLPVGAEVDADSGPYHFGGRLAEVLRRHGLEHVVYLGGGSLPLLGGDEFALVADALAEGNVVVTNNRFSSDLVAFGAAALGRTQPPDSDNQLARALSEQAGLTTHELDRSVATQLDIDGPADLGVLAVTGEGGPRLREYVSSLGLDVDSLRSVMPLLTDRSAQITVAGRVGSHAWRYLERETACRVRLFAEERGMEADGRGAAGHARSLLGFFLERAGPEALFSALAELGDAVFIDTRVILAHSRIHAARSDRFLSDLGRWREIGEPFLRDLTRAAMDASIPAVLGGHSLMSGGLMALNEFAWRDVERKRE